MKSRIELDIDKNNQPLLRITVYKKGDIEDKLLSGLMLKNSMPTKKECHTLRIKHVSSYAEMGDSVFDGDTYEVNSIKDKIYLKEDVISLLQQYGCYLIQKDHEVYMSASEYLEKVDHLV